jgi:hypothetical protein
MAPLRKERIKSDFIFLHAVKMGPRFGCSFIPSENCVRLLPGSARCSQNCEYPFWDGARCPSRPLQIRRPQPAVVAMSRCATPRRSAPSPRSRHGDPDCGRRKHDRGLRERLGRLAELRSSHLSISTAPSTS